jgi:putative SOS response-associated peptidase YedK
MPALLEDSDWAKWLGEEPASVEDLKTILRVSTRDLDVTRASKPPSSPKRDTGQPRLF